jgi:hypothetical protein
MLHCPTCDPPKVCKAEPVGESAPCGIEFTLTFLNSLGHRCFDHILRVRAQREATLEARHSLVARGKTEGNDATCSNEIAQRSLVGIREHNAFRTIFGRKGFNHRELQTRAPNQAVHDFTVRISLELDAHIDTASRRPNRLSLAQMTDEVRTLSGNGDLQIRHTPRSVLAKNFGLDKEVLTKWPKEG